MNKIDKVKSMPPYIRVAKDHSYFPDWREDVANGEPHPLQLELDEFVRVTVGMAYTDHLFTNDWQEAQMYSKPMNEIEEQVIKSFMRTPKIAWAVDNSFDGLYIRREVDHTQEKVVFHFSCYLKEIQATYWRLRFGNIN